MQLAKALLLLAFGSLSAHGYCHFKLQLLLNRYPNSICNGQPWMDTNPTHDGVRMHEGKCKDWKDGLEFGSFAVQWMPNVDGEDISCHESCDLLVYKEKHCGRKERSMIKEWPQLYPIYAIQRVSVQRALLCCVE